VIVWRCGVFVIFAALSCTTSIVGAGEGCLSQMFPPSGPYRSSALMLCCPDNYCRKPCPCVAHPQGWCPDDYRCKPLPCPCHPIGWYPDDYCRKPMPSLCWPPLRANVSCGGL
jgi:hypothetical protein